MTLSRAELRPFTPRSKAEEVAIGLFTTAYNDPEERPIKALFEVLAEYDLAESYLAWCILQNLDPTSETAITQYDNCHWVYFVAWAMLGWPEFEQRMNHARLIVASYG